jgi:hypothetical protein
MRFVSGSWIRSFLSLPDNGGLNVLDLPLQSKDLKFQLLSGGLFQFEKSDEAAEMFDRDVCDRARRII